MKYANYLVEWIKEEVQKAKAKGIIVGLSGGVDSSVVATLGKKAFPNNSLGVFMPINNMGKDLEDAQNVASFLDLKTQMVDLTKTYEQIIESTKIKNNFGKANVKPRLRMTALYALASENNYLVLGTDNAAEWILGYFTKYGDGGVDLLPIVNLTKGEVKQMAKDFQLPEIIYTKKPTAALWENQYDEEELGFSYDYVDKYLQNKNIDPQIKEKIEKQIAKTEHKRKPLPTPLTIKEFLKNKN